MKKTYIIIGIVGFLALLGVVGYWYRQKQLAKTPKPQPQTPESTDKLPDMGNFSGTVSGISNVLSAGILLVVVLVGMIVLLIVYGASWTAKKAAQNPDKAFDVAERAAGIYGASRGGRR